MDKEQIKITKKQKLEFQNYFGVIFERLNNFGDKIPYNTMLSIKEMIGDREKIILEDLFTINEK